MDTPACLSTFPSPFDLPNLSKHKPAHLALCSRSFWGSASGCTRTRISAPRTSHSNQTLCQSLLPHPHCGCRRWEAQHSLSLHRPRSGCPHPTHTAALSPRLPCSTGVCLFWKENNVPCRESSGGQVGVTLNKDVKGPEGGRVGTRTPCNSWTNRAAEGAQPEAGAGQTRSGLSWAGVASGKPRRALWTEVPLLHPQHMSVDPGLSWI